MAAEKSPRIKVAFVTVPVVSDDRWLMAVCRYHKYLDLRARSTGAMAHKALTGEMSMVGRFEVIPPDPKSRERHAVSQAKLDLDPLDGKALQHLIANVGDIPPEIRNEAMAARTIQGP